MEKTTRSIKIPGHLKMVAKGLYAIKIHYGCLYNDMANKELGMTYRYDKDIARHSKY